MNKSCCKFNRGKMYWYMLSGFLYSVLTLGFLSPLAEYTVTNYKINSTYIDGKKLKFTGTAKGMMGASYKWFLISIAIIVVVNFVIQLINNKIHLPFSIGTSSVISIVTAVIYKRNINLYIMKHTHFEDTKEKQYNSYYTFNFWQMVRNLVLTYIINIFSVLTLYGVTSTINDRYNSLRKVIDDTRFTYHSRKWKNFWIWLLNLILSIMTFGLFLPMAFIKNMEALAGNIHIKEAEIA